MSVERVASGTGLVNVYNFLAETFPERVDKTVHDGEKIYCRFLEEDSVYFLYREQDSKKCGFGEYCCGEKDSG